MGASRQLIVKFGPQVLMTSTLTGPTFTIGRLPDSGMPLPDADVSPLHAEIRIQSARAVLTDLGSENGTYISGVRLLPNQPEVLANGARIQIGPYEIVYRSEIDGSTEENPAAVDGARPAPVEPVSDNTPRLRFATGLPDASVDGVGAASRYVPYLPVIFHENDFLSRFLQIFETMWEPLEQRQDFIHMYFSPRTCPASWLPWLASWFGLELSEYLPESRARLLLAEATEMFRQRGTMYGMSRLIELSTGIRPQITEDPSEPNVFRFSISLANNTDPDVVATIRRLVNTHKPAHTGYVIEVQQ